MGKSGFFFFLTSMLPVLYFLNPKEAERTLIYEKTIREFTIIENDTLSYTLKLALDDSGRPQYFFRNIFTPVCYTNECKPVYVNFYWDLLGNYMRYDLPKGKILTKVDHDEFKQEDYDKLADILSRPNSIFAELQMEDLITKGTDSLTSDVDAKTGATLKTIKNEVIDGAVYTCFTLWKIAYGDQVVSKMKNITGTYLDNDMLHSFLNSSNFHYQYAAMEKVIDNKGQVKKEFEKDIEKVIGGKNLFTARTALQKAGDNFFSGTPRQNWLWSTYQSASYPMQIAILKKLENIPLSVPFIENLTKTLPESNTEQFKYKVGLLTKQNGIPQTALNHMANSLETENPEYTKAIYQLLKRFPPKSKEAITKMNQYASGKN
jgi:hypothetical protein